MYIDVCYVICEESIQTHIYTRKLSNFFNFICRIYLQSIKEINAPNKNSIINKNFV